MSGRRSSAVAAGLAAAVVALSAPAGAQPTPGAWKKALLSHDLPLSVLPADDGARHRRDTVGVFDLIEVGISLRFAGLELPETVTFDVTFETQQRIVDGFPLLAAFYAPLSIRELGGPEMDFVHSADSGELAVFLDQPLPAGVTRTYVIEARLDFPCDTPPGCSNERFLHLAEAAWYPMSLEHPVDDRFRVRLELDAPGDMLVTGTGTHLGPPVSAGGRIRASFVTERPTILPSFSVGPYSQGGAGIVEVYGPRGDELPPARAYMINIGQTAIQVYSALFGQYPFGRLGIAAIDTEAGAGLGPQANILLPDVFWQLPPDDPAYAEVVREVTSHEVGHQYFFNLLGVVDNGEAWMSEGFAEYASTRMSEVATGTRDHARINYWSYVHLVPPDEDRALWGEGVSASPHYFELVYQKGSAVLHALRHRVGTEDWDAVFRGWVGSFAGQIVTTRDFERYLGDALGFDVEPFFDQWVYGAGVAELRVHTTRGRTERAPVTVDIRQPAGTQRRYTGLVPLRLHRADGTSSTVVVELAEQPVTVDLDGAQWIEVDPDLTFFRTVRADPAGDVNLDGVVDGMDLLDLHARQGLATMRDTPTGPGIEPNWAERFDLDDDDRVDAGDVDLLLEQFGAGW